MNGSPISLSKDGQDCLFLPANGMFYTAYNQFLNGLSPNFKISTLLYPPLVQDDLAVPNDLSWHLFNDAIDSNFSHLDSVVGIGHSLGATLLLYNAIQHPERYRHLFIIEPALFHPLFCYAYGSLNWVGVARTFHPMVRLTKRRRITFESKDMIYQSWRKREQFSALSNQSLHDFIDASFVKRNHLWHLRFNKDWESAIYASCCSLDMDIWRQLHTISHKVTIIAGETSNTLFSITKKKLLTFNQLQLHTVKNSTHLLPFEYPCELVQLIKRY